MVHLNRTSGARNPRVPARFALAGGLNGMAMRVEGCDGEMKHALYRPSASLCSVRLIRTCRAKLYVHARQVSYASDLPLVDRADRPPLVQCADMPSPGCRQIRMSVKRGQTNMGRAVHDHAVLQRVRNQPSFPPKL